MLLMLIEGRAILARSAANCAKLMIFWRGFTLLFEQVVMSLAREMPASAVARHVGITDKRIWRIIHYYIFKAMNKIDLSGTCGVGLDETASKRGHSYVTIFINIDRESRPVIFACPAKARAILKGDMTRTEEQQAALKELAECGLHTTTAFRVKELVRWVREVDSKSSARWRANCFLTFARQLIGEEVLLTPVCNELNSLEKYFSRILRHWDSMLSNARLEGMNGLFQAARSHARGYRNQNNFIAITYLIGAPIAQTLWP